MFTLHHIGILSTFNFMGKYFWSDIFLVWFEKMSDQKNSPVILRILITLILKHINLILHLRVKYYSIYTYALSITTKI